MIAIQANANKKAFQNLSVKEKKIEDRNTILLNYVDIYQQELDELSERDRDLDQVYKSLLSKIILGKTNYQEFQKISMIMNSKKEMLQNQVEILQKTIPYEIDRLEKQIQKQAENYNDQIQEIKRRIEGYKADVQHKNKQIVDCKALCQMILNQRSDIEEFFIQGIEKVKVATKEEVLVEKDQILKYVFGKINARTKKQDWKNFLKEEIYEFNESELEINN